VFHTTDWYSADMADFPCGASSQVIARRNVFGSVHVAMKAMFAHRGPGAFLILPERRTPLFSSADGSMLPEPSSFEIIGISSSSETSFALL
jgi:hypothetical protein